MNDAEPARLKIVKKILQRARSRGLNVMEQDDPLPLFRQLPYDCAVNGGGVPSAIIIGVGVARR